MCLIRVNTMSHQHWDDRAVSDRPSASGGGAFLQLELGTGVLNQGANSRWDDMCLHA
jgi:hypothetical protein